MLRQQIKPSHRVHGTLQGKDWAANSKCRGYMCFVRSAHWLAVIPDYAWMK